MPQPTTTQHIHIYANEISINFDNKKPSQIDTALQSVSQDHEDSLRGGNSLRDRSQLYSATVDRLALPSISEMNQIDDLMVGVNNGTGMLAVTGRVPGVSNFMQNAN